MGRWYLPLPLTWICTMSMDRKSGPAWYSGGSMKYLSQKKSNGKVRNLKQTQELASGPSITAPGLLPSIHSPYTVAPRVTAPCKRGGAAPPQTEGHSLLLPHARHLAHVAAPHPDEVHLERLCAVDLRAQHQGTRDNNALTLGLGLLGRCLGYRQT